MVKDNIVEFPKKDDEKIDDIEDIQCCYDALCTYCGSTEWNIEVSNKNNIIIEAFVCAQCRYRVDLGVEIVFKDREGDDTWEIHLRSHNAAIAYFVNRENV